MTTDTFGEQQFCGQCGSRLSPDRSCQNIQCSMYRRPSSPSYPSQAPTALSSGPQTNSTTPISPTWGGPGQVSSPSQPLAQPPRWDGPPIGSSNPQYPSQPSGWNAPVVNPSSAQYPPQPPRSDSPLAGSFPSQPQGSKIHPRPNTRIYQIVIIALVVLLIGAVVLFLVKPGQSSQPLVTSNTPTALNQSTTIPSGGTTPAPTPTDIPTATPFPNATPSPTPTATAQTAVLPCIVNVGTWTNGSSDWKVLNGVLLNDGTGNYPGNGSPSIVAPCQLGDTANYAVETKVQAIKLVKYPCFGITLRGNPAGQWQGYRANVGSCNCYSCFDKVTFGGVGNVDAQATFDPGTTLHTYRVEARDNTIKLFIDGGLILNITDNRYLTGSEVGLYCYGVQLQVTSFKVTAL